MENKRFDLVRKQAEKLAKITRHACKIEVDDKVTIEKAKKKIYEIMEQIESIMTQNTL
jgi:uncharacterized membrane protein